MYEEHFGLKSNPFRSNAEGASVFVGPTQNKTMSRLHKALVDADNIVTVSGPVGVGKTTIVTRALETNKRNQMVAWIGRMRLAPDEVMQLLLAGFGITKQVPGTSLPMMGVWNFLQYTFWCHLFDLAFGRGKTQRRTAINHLVVRKLASSGNEQPNLKTRKQPTQPCLQKFLGLYF